MEADAAVLFEKAVQSLKRANNELCRPEEDVVAAVVCKISQEATTNYLKGFLLMKGIQPPEGASISTLYEKCRSINSHFDKIDISGHECDVHLESRFCSGTENQSRCFDIADHLDTFLREEQIIQ